MYALALLLGLWPVLGPRVVARVDPTLAVGLSLPGYSLISFKQAAANLDELDFMQRRQPRARALTEERAQRDPWGRAWRWRPASGSYNVPTYPYVPITPSAVYSTGPDGVDQLGAGDDVLEADARGHPGLRWFPSQSAGGFMPCICAFVLFMLAAFTRSSAIAPREPSPWRELLRALVIAAPPSAAGLVWVLSAADVDGALQDSGAQGPALLPGRVVLPVSWALFCSLAALLWRLSRPRRAETA